MPSEAPTLPNYFKDTKTAGQEDISELQKWSIGSSVLIFSTFRLQIRSKARALKERFPLEACSKEVQEASKAAKAAAQAKKLQRSFRRRPFKHDSLVDALPSYQTQQRFGNTPGRPRMSKFHSATDAAGVYHSFHVLLHLGPSCCLSTLKVSLCTRGFLHKL